MAVDPTALPESDEAELNGNQVYLPAWVSQVTASAATAVSVLILVLGLATVYWTVKLIVSGYSPALVSDEWGVLFTLIQTHGHLGVRDLWAQHNEHRIIIQRLLSLADIFWFGNKGISLHVEILLAQTLHLGVFIYACHRFAKFSGWVLLTLAGVFAYCFFSPLQMENFDWGFQVCFVLVGLAASGSIVLLIFSKQIVNGRRPALLFAAAIASAVISEMSVANGLLIWPVLLLVGFILDLSWRKQVYLLLAAICGIGAYLIGYHSPPYHSNPVESLHHPGLVLKYMLTCLGFSWDPALPNTSLWPTPVESIAFVGILLMIGLAIACVVRRGAAPALLVFVAADSLFFIATIAMAATGRIRFGYVQATSSRYQSFALFFWACMAITAFALCRNKRSSRNLVLQAGIFIILLGSLNRWGLIKRTEMARKARLDKGWDAALSGRLTDPAVASLFPDPANLYIAVQYMIANHLVHPVQPTLVIMPKAAGCVGWIDGAVQTSDGKLIASGWAYDYTKSAPAKAVVLINSDGSVVRSTGTGLARPDVPKTDSTVHSETTGWQAAWTAPPPGSYKAYAVISDRQHCPLDGNVVVVH